REREERERESTMMEEKRGLMGRKTFRRKGKAGESSMGTWDSKTARTAMESAELLKYWPVGLTGSSAISIPVSSCFVSASILDFPVFFPQTSCSLLLFALFSQPRLLAP
ncbi:hypothetical protein U1Q18_001582, partial [Sarracenia purpurea var. burkii]